MTDQFEVLADDLQQLQDAMELVRRLNILLIYKDFYQYFRRVLVARYLLVARTTQYSEAWLGTTQEVTGRVRGNDALWALDSGALFGDLTQKVRITQTGITIASDKEYAARILDLMADKSVFAPDDILFLGDEDLSELELIIERRLIQDADQTLARGGRS